MQEVYRFVRDKLAPVMAIVLTVAFKEVTRNIGFLIDALGFLAKIMAPIIRATVAQAEFFVRAILTQVNLIITGLNFLIRGFNKLPGFLRMGVEIGEIPMITLPSATIGGGQSSGPSYGMFPGAGTTVSPIVTGGDGIGGGIGGGEVDEGDGIGGGSRGTRKKPEATNVTVNVNTPLATKAEIGDAVIQAIRASNAIYGPFIASAF